MEFFRFAPQSYKNPGGKKAARGIKELKMLENSAESPTFAGKA